MIKKRNARILKEKSNQNQLASHLTLVNGMPEQKKLRNFANSQSKQELYEISCEFFYIRKFERYVNGIQTQNV